MTPRLPQTLATPTLQTMSTPPTSPPLDPHTPRRGSRHHHPDHHVHHTPEGLPLINGFNLWHRKWSNLGECEVVQHSHTHTPTLHLSHLTSSKLTPHPLKPAHSLRNLYPILQPSPPLHPLLHLEEQDHLVPPSVDWDLECYVRSEQ